MKKFNFKNDNKSSCERLLKAHLNTIEYINDDVYTSY